MGLGLSLALGTTAVSSAETPTREYVNTTTVTDYYAPIYGLIEIELQAETQPSVTTTTTESLIVEEATHIETAVHDEAAATVVETTSHVSEVNPPETPSPDPDRHAGFDLPNYDLWEDEESQCETNGKWDSKYKYGTTTLSKYRGGLQVETPKLWEYLGGLEFAPTPDKATAEQQMWVAELWLRENGQGSWPICAKGLKFNYRPLRPFEAPPIIEASQDDAVTRNLDNYELAVTPNPGRSEPR